jgi:TPR repeat protein
MTGTRWKEIFPTLRAALNSRLNVAQLAGSGDARPFDDSRSAQARGNHDLLRLLADQGDATAQNELGGMYANGRGTEQDPAQAVKWWRKAADRGYAPAQFSLGSMYEKGVGVPRDYVQAYKWYSLAALRFPASDPVNAAIASEFGKSLAAKMPRALVDEAERLASEWVPAADAGTAPGRAR